VTQNTSDLEAELMFQLRVHKIKGWTREVVFAPPRRWRADFLWEEPQKLVVEVMGGLWGGQGRHSRMDGFSRDAEKSAMAQLLGYTVIYVTPTMLKDGTAIELIKRALRQSKDETLLEQRGAN
jgi:very-short-patch-repair endonuclease